MANNLILAISVGFKANSNLKKPESRFDFSRDTSIPILKNSSHKPTSRETDICVKLSWDLS